jgi:hypothetical protein
MSHLIAEETERGLREIPVRGGFPTRDLTGGMEITEPPGLAHPRVGMETTLGDEERVPFVSRRAYCPESPNNSRVRPEQRPYWPPSPDDTRFYDQGAENILPVTAALYRLLRFAKR